MLFLFFLGFNHSIFSARLHFIGDVCPLQFMLWFSMHSPGFSHPFYYQSNHILVPFVDTILVWFVFVLYVLLFTCECGLFVWFIFNLWFLVGICFRAQVPGVPENRYIITAQKFGPKFTPCSTRRVFVYTLWTPPENCQQTRFTKVEAMNILVLKALARYNHAVNTLQIF